MSYVCVIRLNRTLSLTITLISLEETNTIINSANSQFIRGYEPKPLPQLRLRSLSIHIEC